LSMQRPEDQTYATHNLPCSFLLCLFLFFFFDCYLAHQVTEGNADTLVDTTRNLALCYNWEYNYISSRL
jgi:hypothetical protein